MSSNLNIITEMVKLGNQNHFKVRISLIIFLWVVSCHFSCAQEKIMPVIDIHLHAYESVSPGISASWTGEPYAQRLLSPVNAESHKSMSWQEIQKNNIQLALVSSTSITALREWKSLAPDRFITGIQTNNGVPILSPDSLKLMKEQGIIDVLGELGLQYYGKKPTDTVMMAYYAIAEKNNIPVCLHTGLGPPGGPHTFAPEFRITLGKPTLFEPVLVKYPQLKAFLAHAGWPYMEETIAMMYIYPELYVDIGVLAWALPKKAFYQALESLMDAGFGKRIMFGTDQMIWPGAISIAVETVKNVPFLNDEEKRDILYYNAARFLNLSKELIEQHHSR